MLSRRSTSTLALLAACAACPLFAHIPLHNPSNKQPLFWEHPGNISIVINATGSDDIVDGSHFTALRNAINGWNQVAGTSAHLSENTSASQQARTDWHNNIHLMLFDENNSSGYFPSGSATVAITPVYFYSSGKIADADVLFNGHGFQFTTAATPGNFDVQAVATHELGHFLGLDHSGWAGASMYPYVSSAVIAQRSLSLDDEHGVRDRYSALPFGSITGTVRRASDSSIVRGAHVVARDLFGRTTGAALADNSGAFAIRGLDSGLYSVYATPLDFPVSSANLTSGHSVQTDFQSTSGASAIVVAGLATAYGDLLVNADSTLSLGRASDTLPLSATSGATTLHSLRGSGLGAMCSLQPSDPLITVTPTFWSGSTMVMFTVQVPAGAAIGHVDLEVINGAGERSILPAAIEIVPPVPTITNVVPSFGSNLGGTPIVITGTGFNAGARVVIGDSIYVDGLIGGCTVLTPTTIVLTTAPTPASTYDVVVADPSGIEARRIGGYDFDDIPGIQSVFPAIGSDLGGTRVTIAGSSFVAPMTVRIDGVVQSLVTIDSPTLLHVMTDAGVAGGPYTLELENASGQIASAVFSYAAQSDPTITSIAPGSAPSAGGHEVTISGADFNVNSSVVFGVDPVTGAGGTPAAAVTFVDANTLLVQTPAHASGSVAVMVQDSATGQAVVLASAFTFAGAGGGGGGGGCYTVPSDDPWNGRDALAGAGWMIVVFALLAHAAARMRRRVALTMSTAQ